MTKNRSIDKQSLKIIAEPEDLFEDAQALTMERLAKMFAMFQTSKPRAQI